LPDPPSGPTPPASPDTRDFSSAANAKEGNLLPANGEKNRTANTCISVTTARLYRPAIAIPIAGSHADAAPQHPRFRGPSQSADARRSPMRSALSPLSYMLTVGDFVARRHPA
jgi:hypothetical protein